MIEDRSVLTRPAEPPDEVRSYGESADEVIDVWFAEGGSGRPMVVVVHGGFWRPDYDRIHVRPMATALRAAGWDVAAIEYRRQPGDPDVTVDDVRSAVTAVGDRPFVTIGHSAGGHLVLWLAAADPPNLAATIALAPVADLCRAHALDLDDGAVADFVGGVPDDRPDLDPLRLPSPGSPVVIVHGTDDEIVPLAVSESYVAGHPSSRLVRVADAGHFSVIDPLSSAWPTVLDQLSGFTAVR